MHTRKRRERHRRTETNKERDHTSGCSWSSTPSLMPESAGSTLRLWNPFFQRRRPREARTFAAASLCLFRSLLVESTCAGRSSTKVLWALLRPTSFHRRRLPSCRRSHSSHREPKRPNVFWEKEGRSLFPIQPASNLKQTPIPIQPRVALLRAEPEHQAHHPCGRAWISSQPTTTPLGQNMPHHTSMPGGSAGSRPWQRSTLGG